MEKIIEKLLEEKFAEPDFQDCFLVEVKVHKNKHVEVFMDADSGITFDKCQKISRFLEAHFDTNEWFGDNYVLDVSSPGIGRPLQLLRQYQKNIGRTLELKTRSGRVVEGNLKAVSEAQITVEAKIIPEGKKKPEPVTLEIPLEDIEQAVVKVSW